MYIKKLFTNSNLKFRNEYFLFLLPVFFVFHGVVDFGAFLTYGEIASLLTEYLLITFGCLFLFCLFFKSFRKAAVFSCIILLFDYYFGTLHDALKQWLGSGLLVSYSFLLPVIGVLFILLLVYFKRTGKKFDVASKYLNGLLIAFLLVDVFAFSMKDSDKPLVARNHAVYQPELAEGLKPCDTCVKEDIYLVVADEYAGKKQLKEFFRFDNTPFENELTKRGFNVVQNSISNYRMTVLSMASMFHLNYLPGIEKKSQEQLYEMGTAMIKRNPFFDYLLLNGYEIKNYSSFDVIDKVPFSEGFFKKGTDLIRSHTFTGRIMIDIGHHLGVTLGLQSDRKRIEEGLRFEAMTESRKIDTVIKHTKLPSEKPRLFYIHFLMPHGPILLDENEFPVIYKRIFDDKNNRDEKKNYLGYLKYCNKKTLHLIDQIQGTNKNPFSIIFMSDHGFRGGYPPFEQFQVPMELQFMNINAVYYSNGRNQAYYNGLSNVNLLRTLLNDKFHQKLPLLKDSTVQ